MKVSSTKEDRRFSVFEATIARQKAEDLSSENSKSKNGNVSSKSHSKFPTNFIKTSRYTAVTFVPQSLLIQFKQYANIYFLVIGVLQSIPIISPISAYVAIAPLIIVLLVSMLREGYEDYQRHKSDDEQNYGAKARRIASPTDRTETEIAWADIEVGDILRISQDECFPADLLVLGSDLDGVCYIETGALDGEKNLKPKSALTETAQFFDTRNPSQLNPGQQQQQQEQASFQNANMQFSLDIFAKAPDADPNNFVGSIAFNSKTIERPSDQNQLLPRGAFLRNTESIFAIVVYTGMDTKIMRNAEEPKPKSSDMQETMNQLILCILLFQLMCGLIMASCNFYWLEDNNGLYPYLYLNKSGLSHASQSVISYFSYFILFNTMIPISLIVSLEMVKLVQSFFITHDQEMYSPHNDKWPKVMTSTINEELGQIEYIFSDKTGTLTMNQMKFKMAIIGTTLYGDKPRIQIKPPAHPPVLAGSAPDQPGHSASQQQQQNKDNFIFQDDGLDSLLREQKGSRNPNINLTLTSLDGQASFEMKSQLDLAREYFSLLALTHECIVEKKPNDDGSMRMVYQGPSPDEITLVDAAYHMGFTFVGKTSDSLLVEVNKTNDREIEGEVKKQVQSVRRINVFEFSSARKRNTLILQDANGVYKMYVKGADNVVKERLRTDIHQPFLSNADAKLTEFSVVGLRTLLIGMKVMSKAEVDHFTNTFNALASSPNRKEELEKLADEVERGFFLLGATAVEDQLQDGVPETIEDFLRANIKVWMLTGDKLETAENIAKSCRLIRADFELLILNNKNENVIRVELMDVLWARFKKLKDSQIRKCFLVEGDCLKVIFDPKNEDLKKRFVQITKACESVVCCRVSPVQKAQVVRSIKEGLGKITLAIGDGANDVNMIQSAHIGCGIYGNEGMRAVQSSDFALGEFKYLWRLIFVHGRWSYIRISEMIVYFFYKNMIFTIPQFFFAFYCGFSGQTVFDDVFISLYNLVFTALPLVIRAILDQDVNYKYLPDWKGSEQLSQEDARRTQRLIEKRRTYVREKLPLMYYVGQQKQLFTTRLFMEWVGVGIAHGLIIFYIAYFSVGDHIYESDGYTSDLWSFSLIIFTSVVFIANMKLAINTRYWTWLSHFAFYVTSFGFYILVFFVAGQLTSNNVVETPNYLVTTPHFYLVIFGVVAGIFGFDLSILAVKDLFLDKSKEKTMRKLMKSIPKQSAENNRWVFGGSQLEIESNIMSFVENNLNDSVRSIHSNHAIIPPVLIPSHNQYNSNNNNHENSKKNNTQNNYNTSNNDHHMQLNDYNNADSNKNRKQKVNTIDIIDGGGPASGLSPMDMNSVPLMASTSAQGATEIPMIFSSVVVPDIPTNKPATTLNDILEKDVNSKKGLRNPSMNGMRNLSIGSNNQNTASRPNRLVFKSPDEQPRQEKEEIFVPDPVYNIAFSMSDDDDDEEEEDVQNRNSGNDGDNPHQEYFETCRSDDQPVGERNFQFVGSQHSQEDDQHFQIDSAQHRKSNNYLTNQKLNQKNHDIYTPQKYLDPGNQHYQPQTISSDQNLRIKEARTPGTPQVTDESYHNNHNNNQYQYNNFVLSNHSRHPLTSSSMQKQQQHQKNQNDYMMNKPAQSHKSYSTKEDNI